MNSDFLLMEYGMVIDYIEYDDRILLRLDYKRL